MTNEKKGTQAFRDSFTGANKIAPATATGQRSFNGVQAMQPKPSSSTNSGGSQQSTGNQSGQNSGQSNKK